MLVFVGFSLCGCATSRDTAPLITSFADIDRSGLSEGQVALLLKAEEDYAAVMAGKTPKNARLKHWLRDGGTRMYEGDGYYLSANHGIEMREGVHGFIVGPSITLDRKITGGKAISWTDTHFVAHPGNE